ncbi:unnamed protein product [Thelazia callipaeda]|uniref:Protein Spindly n=1 Tax=Thelazia callipaeda TaxID=103827 RepID=A0A0N5D8Q6_THECL|nr:unnamed protein product [Thelazia callipaeda]
MEIEVEQLKLKLQESESKQLAIAHLAKEVLDKDKEKDQRLLTLTEENQQLLQDLTRLQALIKSRDEYLADTESEVAKLRSEIAEINSCKSGYLEMEQKLSLLRAEVDEKTGMLLQRQQEVQDLKKILVSKERELQEVSKKPETIVPHTPNKFSESEQTKLKEKMVILYIELESEKIVMAEEISILQEKLLFTNRNLENERSRVEELTTICNGYKHDVDELKVLCNELTSKLENSNKSKMAKKGNSMFFEFVDERVKLEKDLLTLKAQNDFLISQKEANELELNELRHELVLALTSHKDKETLGGDTSTLQSEISRLRTEVMTLNTKLRNRYSENIEESVPNTSRVVDFKEFAFNSLKEEVKVLYGKLEKAEKDRTEYFDKAREYEIRYLDQHRRSRELANLVESMKKRLVLDSKKHSNNAFLTTLKPCREALSEQITSLNEKIADINQIDSGDPAISVMQSSLMYSVSDPKISANPTKEEKIADRKNVSDPIPHGAAVADQNEAPNTTLKPSEEKVSTKKRLKFELRNEESKQISDDNRLDEYIFKRRPERKIIKKVCEANRL